MKEIGSIFAWHERPLTRPSDTLSPKGEGEVSNTPLLEPSQAIKGNIFLAPWGEDARRAGEGRLSFCREAIYLIANNEMANGKKAMLPKYTCDTVIAPFQQLGYDYQFYPVCKDLTIDIPKAKEIFSEFHPNLIVVHPYFGMDLTE